MTPWHKVISKRKNLHPYNQYKSDIYYNCISKFCKIFLYLTNVKENHFLRVLRPPINSDIIAHTHTHTHTHAQLPFPYFIWHILDDVYFPRLFKKHLIQKYKLFRFLSKKKKKKQKALKACKGGMHLKRLEIIAIVHCLLLWNC